MLPVRRPAAKGRGGRLTLALVDELRTWPADAFETLIASLSREEAAALWWEWRAFWARPDQLAPPGDWDYWWLFGAKGTGKTRSAAEWVNARAEAGHGPIQLIAGVDDDIGATMVGGPSGILACARPDFMPEWEPSKKRLTWPNRVQGLGFSAEEPKRLHGKGCQTAWYDDLTGWKSRAKETFDLGAFNLREGPDARCVLTANPEESELIISLFDDPTRLIVRTDSQLDQNLANLDPKYARRLGQFAGTELELRHRHGVMVRTSASNPFRGLDFDKAPIRIHDAGEIVRLALALDPADGCGPQHDEWGVGIAGERVDGHVVGLEDNSGDYEAPDAAEAGLELLDRWAALYPNAALEVCAEVNRGEDKVRGTLAAAYWRRHAEGRSRRPPPEVIPVRARDGKVLRAGDLRGLYLGGLLHHLVGMAPCEAQQRGWNPLAPKRPKQDDKIDWLVQVVRHLRRLDAGGPPLERWAPAAGSPALAGRYADSDPRRGAYQFRGRRR